MFPIIRSLRARRAVILQEAAQLIFEHGAIARHVAKMRVADAYLADDVAGTRRATRVVGEIEERLPGMFGQCNQRGGGRVAVLWQGVRMRIRTGRA